MRKETFVYLFTAVAIMSASLSVGAQGSDRRMGTWKLNIAKSKYDPGPPPKNQTIKYEPSAGGFKFTSEGLDAQGQATHTETIAKLDGKDYPVSRPKGSPPGATSRLRFGESAW